MIYSHTSLFLFYLLVWRHCQKMLMILSFSSSFSLTDSLQEAGSVGTKTIILAGELSAISAVHILRLNKKNTDFLSVKKNQGYMSNHNQKTTFFRHKLNMDLACNCRNRKNFKITKREWCTIETLINNSSAKESVFYPFQWTICASNRTWRRYYFFRTF